MRLIHSALTRGATPAKKKCEKYQLLITNYVFKYDMCLKTFVELALILTNFATHDLSIDFGFTARQHNTENQITSKQILTFHQ